MSKLDELKAAATLTGTRLKSDGVRTVISPGELPIFIVYQTSGQTPLAARAEYLAALVNAHTAGHLVEVSDRLPHESALDRALRSEAQLKVDLDSAHRENGRLQSAVETYRNRVRILNDEKLELGNRLVRDREAAKVAAKVDDGRPMTTDVFLVELFAACDDHFDRTEAIQHWIHGGWNEAVAYLAEDDGDA